MSFIPSDPASDTVFELRRYTLRPGARETLIALFDAEFVETQEADGMSVVGQFRDLDRPDHFVWFRGFASHDLRNAALPRFYGGSVWAGHGPAANATMIDSDDVLLLKPADGGVGFANLPARPDPNEVERQAGPILVATHHLLPQSGEAEARRLAAAIADAVSGTHLLASLISDHSVNGFPRLPVREGENVVVTVAKSAIGEDRAFAERLRDAGSGSGIPIASAMVARLAPTRRSRLR